ncbi:MAG TPA: hypothetical protein VJA23_06390 [Candidatus Nanoarchaeia archaeon]|nr:hypothetical protein [Candidatus Nanoarchaeia archaeon]
MKEIPQEIKTGEIISVAVKVDSITNETLEKLKAKGLVINDTEQSKTYGNVIFGMINKSKAKDLPGEVNEGVSEKEYKMEVLKEIVIAQAPDFQQSQQELGFMIEDQIVLDEKREKMGILVGPLIEDQLWERVEKEEFVPVFIHFRIEEWENFEKNTKEVQLELANDIKVEASGKMGITGFITKNGLKKIVNKRYIIRIGTRLP